MKTSTEEGTLNGRITTSLLLMTGAFWAGMGATPAFGDIIYSGPQNIVLQGMPNSSGGWGINISADPATLIILNLQITENSAAVGGGVDTYPDTTEVGLASSSTDFPLVARFQYGDPYPSNPVFGIGLETLWGYGTTVGNGDFYAAMELGASGMGPQGEGWVHLEVSDTDTTSPLLTVEGWAYAIGETIASIGQGSPAPGPSGSGSGSSGGGTSVPEIDPSSGVGALTLLSGALLVVRGRRRVLPR